MNRLGINSNYCPSDVCLTVDSDFCGNLTYHCESSVPFATVADLYESKRKIDVLNTMNNDMTHTIIEMKDEIKKLRKVLANLSTVVNDLVAINQ